MLLQRLMYETVNNNAFGRGKIPGAPELAPRSGFTDIVYRSRYLKFQFVGRSFLYQADVVNHK